MVFGGFDFFGCFLNCIWWLLMVDGWSFLDGVHLFQGFFFVICLVLGCFG